MTIQVHLGSRSYPIQIEFGCLDRLEASFPKDKEENLKVIADEVVAPLYANPLVENLRALGHDAQLFTFAAGENSKSIKQVQRLWDELLSSGVDRQTQIIAVGGGVTGDLAGFVAATLMRGLPFVQVPTSLLAQVDSSVGGKVGVNLPQAKNIVGAFWQPSKVIIDPTVLRTLDKRHFAAGMAEVIKYGVIMDAEFFQFLESNVEAIRSLEVNVLTKMISRCCELKAQVVAEDETESTGRRAILNYGHTFGHAFEKVFGYGEYLHGEAIAIGMDCAARFAEKMGWVDQPMVQRQADLFRAFDLPVRLPETIDEQTQQKIVRAMRLDKKATTSAINLILPTEIGSVKIEQDVDESDILDVL